MLPPRDLRFCDFTNTESTQRILALSAAPDDTPNFNDILHCLYSFTTLLLLLITQGPHGYEQYIM